MTVKSEVQGIVQALFGAYAGGYLAELTAEATANGSSAVAARLVNIQGVILGRNMSDNQDFVDTILSNMGVPSTNDAYEAAAAWAMGELTAGASRADIVSAAVAFLDGIAAGTIVDSKYTAIAEAFAASVEAGIEYSEDDGAEVFDLGDLQDAAGIDVPFNLTEGLSALAAAQEAEADALAAIADADAENDIDEENELDSEGEFVETYDAEDADDELAAAEELAAEADDDHQDAIIALATARQTASDSELAAALSDAEDAITDAEAQEEYDAYVDALAATEVAAAALVLADGDLAAALAYTDAVDGEDTLVSDEDGEGNTVYFYESAEGEDGFEDGEEVITFDGETFAAAEDLTNDDVPGLTDLVAALNAQLAADAANTEAETDEEEALEALEALGATLYNDVQDAAEDLAVREGEIDDVTAALETKESAEDYASELADLVAAHTSAVADTEDALEALEDAGWNVVTLDGEADDGGEGNDVYLYDETGDEIEDFSAEGDDLIFFGTGYTLVTIDAEDDISADSFGAANTLEIFVQDDGEDTTLWVELETFGGSSTNGISDLIQITLTGTTDVEAALTNSGYFSVQ